MEKQTFSSVFILKESLASYSGTPGAGDISCHTRQQGAHSFHFSQKKYVYSHRERHLAEEAPFCLPKFSEVELLFAMLSIVQRKDAIGKLLKTEFRAI